MLRMVISRPIAVAKEVIETATVLAAEALSNGVIGSRHISEAIIGAPWPPNQVEDIGMAYATWRPIPYKHQAQGY